jgi:DtxR family Mn-dependent transcriptional regulator
MTGAAGMNTGSAILGMTASGGGISKGGFALERTKTMTPSLEDYLKTTYRLRGCRGEIRLTDLAESMSVTKPSASRAVAHLAEKGLVEHEKFGSIWLTDKGIAAAQRLCAKFDTIKRFLTQTLNLSETTAESEACAIEHAIRDETLARMEKFEKCPGCSAARYACRM